MIPMSTSMLMGHQRVEQDPNLFNLKTLFGNHLTEFATSPSLWSEPLFHPKAAAEDLIAPRIDPAGGINSSSPGGETSLQMRQDAQAASAHTTARQMTFHSTDPLVNCPVSTYLTRTLSILPIAID